MRILVACEFSGVVRAAFRQRGHDAWSCDLLAADDGDRHHIRGDVRQVLRDGWDAMIAFPPCTHLALSGARWFEAKAREQAEAIRFVEALWFAPIPSVSVENPRSVLSTRSALRRPSQVVHPWQFGHGEKKETWLWLRGLPLLRPTRIVEGRAPRVHHQPDSRDRWKRRSRTLPGLADAMAQQWGDYLEIFS